MGSPIDFASSIHLLTRVLRVESNLKDAKENGIDPMNIHLVGHSMGCQLCSFIAKGWSINSSIKLWLITFSDFKNLTSTSIGRLTGLDCAGPIFDQCGPAARNPFSNRILRL